MDDIVEDVRNGFERRGNTSIYIPEFETILFNHSFLREF